MPKAPPAPRDYVEAVFAKLVMVYGLPRIEAMHAGQSPEQVRAHWAHELAGVPSGGIAWALANLPPDHPPNVLQFRRLTNTRPEAPQKRLPTAPPSPQVVQAAQARLKAAREALTRGRDPLAWAKTLRAQELRDPASLTRAQRETWRTALGCTDPEGPA